MSLDVFRQHNFNQRSHKSAYPTSLMAYIQSFEVSSTKCVWSFDHLHWYPTSLAQVGLISTLLLGTTLIWFAPFLEHQSPLFNNFEAFLEEFNATLGDLDKERMSRIKIRSFLSNITFNYSICIRVQIIGLWYFMGWSIIRKLIPVWVTRWFERFTAHRARPFNIKSSPCTSCSMWQQALWISTKKAPWTHINNKKKICTTNNTKEFFTYNVNPTFNNLTKRQPHANW